MGRRKNKRKRKETYRGKNELEELVEEDDKWNKWKLWRKKI